eukprot:12923515-Ditylum_brightwellii.AAC.1
MWKATRDGCGIMFDGATDCLSTLGAASSSVGVTKRGGGVTGLDIGGLCCTCIGGTVMMIEFIVTGVHAGDECTLGCGATI